MEEKPSKQQVVAILDQHIFGWAYKDIERASILGEAKLAGFILGTCFIDAMAGFYAGIDREQSKKNSGKRFKDFVKKYIALNFTNGTIVLKIVRKGGDTLWQNT